MANLKVEMHEDNKHAMEEDEEEVVANKVHAVHDDLKAIKTQLKEKHLSHSDKVDARRIMRQLESQYGQLSHETTKSGRKEVAIAMKETARQLKKYLADEPPKPSFETKKQNIMAHVVEAEEEYENKNIPFAIKSKIHAKFEDMKESLEEEGVEKHQLKATLKSELEEIKTLSSKAEKVQKNPR